MRGIAGSTLLLLVGAIVAGCAAPESSKGPLDESSAAQATESGPDSAPPIMQGDTGSQKWNHLELIDCAGFSVLRHRLAAEPFPLTSPTSNARSGITDSYEMLAFACERAVSPTGEVVFNASLVAEIHTNFTAPNGDIYSGSFIGPYWTHQISAGPIEFARWLEPHLPVHHAAVEVAHTEISTPGSAWTGRIDGPNGTFVAAGETTTPTPIFPSDFGGVVRAAFGLNPTTWLDLTMALEDGGHPVTAHWTADNHFGVARFDSPRDAQSGPDLLWSPGGSVTLSFGAEA